MSKTHIYTYTYPREEEIKVKQNIFGDWKYSKIANVLL